MNLNVIVSGNNWYEPFVYCGLMFQKRFQCNISKNYREGHTNILIYDLFWSLKWNKRTDIAWLDTPNSLERLKQPIRLGYIKPSWKRLYVTCEWNRELAQNVGVHVDDVIHRFINPIAFTIQYKEKKRDFSVIGANYPYDRKNLRLIAKVCDDLKLDLEALTDAPFIKRKLKRGVSDEEKFKWLSESKFILHIPFSGSFEMPVAEAMACGVVPIYSEIPCLKEYAVGIPVKTSGLTTVMTQDGLIYKYIIEYDDVVEAVKYALGMRKETYLDLSEKCRLKAKEMDSEVKERWGIILGVLSPAEKFISNIT
jgi:glycosyltransferase involved in cell wall biosynthesis